MRLVDIMSDAETAHAAGKLAEFLGACGMDVVRSDFVQYPIADSLARALSSRNHQYEATFVMIRDDPILLPEYLRELPA